MRYSGLVLLRLCVHCYCTVIGVLFTLVWCWLQSWQSILFVMPVSFSVKCANFFFGLYNFLCSVFVGKKDAQDSESPQSIK